MSLQNAYVRLNSKWASKLGSLYTQYRPTGPINPVTEATQIATVDALFDASVSLAFNAPSVFGNALFAAIVNPTLVQALDYLTGVDGTFLIASTEPLKPIFAVRCDRLATFSRPTPQPSSPGYYSGEVAGADTPLMMNVPCSILNGTKGQRNAAEELPADSRLPWIQLLAPYFPGVILTESDRITDDTGRNFVISSCELSVLGWRLTAELVAP